MDSQEIEVIKGLLTQQELRLLTSFAVDPTHLPTVREPTGLALQDRILFELSRREALLDRLEERIGSTIFLASAELCEPSNSSTRSSPNFTAVVPIGGPLLTTGASKPLSEQQIPPGDCLLIPSGLAWAVGEKPPSMLVLRFADRTALDVESDCPRFIELRNRDRRRARSATRPPLRGPRNAFAIAETYLPLAVPQGPANGPLLVGHTDVFHDLELWFSSGAACPASPLAEQLRIGVGDRPSAESVVYFEPGRPPLDDVDQPFLQLNFVGPPVGPGLMVQEQATRGASLPERTVYLTNLTVERRSIAPGEPWRVGVLPSDLLVVIDRGRLSVRGHELVAPSLAYLPAGVPVSAAAVDAAAEIRVVSMTGVVQRLSNEPRPRSSEPLRPGTGFVVACIPIAAKRWTTDWRTMCRHLDATLRSFYAQTDPHWRVILVGNEPPDLSIELDDRVEFLATTRDDTDGSLAAAYADAGFKRALGERRARDRGATYIFFCDSDDLPSKRLVEFVRKEAHPYGYVLGRGVIYDAARQRLAPLPLRGDVYSLDEQSASTFIFNANAVPQIINSPINRDGHVRFRERMYLSGRPLLDVRFPSLAYVRFTMENMSDVFVASEKRAKRDERLIDAIASEAMPLSPELVDEFSLASLLTTASVPAKSASAWLSILVCTHNRPEGLSRLLASIVPQLAGRDRELIVINDGTHDARYSEVIGRYATALRYEPLPKSLGISGARTRSAELARGQFLVFTDDDCEVPPHWLDWLEATLNTHPELDVVAGIGRPLDLEQANFVGQVQAHYGLLPKPHWLGGIDHCFVTACLAVRGSTFRQVGGFNSGEVFAMAGEDTELSLRLIRSGARTRIDHEWHVFHALGRSLSAEMRRFGRYGFANAQLSKTSGSPAHYDHLKNMRQQDVPAKFWEHFRKSRSTSTGFSSNPLLRLGSRVAVSLIQASYDEGAARGAAAKLSSR